MDSVARIRGLLRDLDGEPRERERAVAEIAMLLINHEQRLNRLEEALRRIPMQGGRV